MHKNTYNKVLLKNLSFQTFSLILQGNCTGRIACVYFHIFSKASVFKIGSSSSSCICIASTYMHHGMKCDLHCPHGACISCHLCRCVWRKYIKLKVFKIRHTVGSRIIGSLDKDKQNKFYKYWAILYAPKNTN